MSETIAQVKMIVMDMDGTLLNNQHMITPLTLSALMEAQAQGIKLVLASGRNYRTLTEYGELLQMPQNDGYFIGVNGAAITETKTMHTQMIRQLQLSEIAEIFEIAAPFQVEVMGVLDDTIYDLIPPAVKEYKKTYRAANNIAEDVPWTAGNKALIADQRRGYDHIHYIKTHTEIPCPVNKICIAHDADVLKPVYEKCLKQLGERFNFGRTTARWIEVTPKGIDKGSTLKKLAAQYGIDMDEIIVFGDGENDLPMLEVVKYPIAMGNAMESVKAMAYAVCDDNNQDGIGKYMQEHILKKV